MKKNKIKLDQFDFVKLKELDEKLLLKIVGGGDENIKLKPNQCNVPNYSYSAQSNIDVESNSER